MTTPSDSNATPCPDPLVADTVYPCAHEVFTQELPKLADIKDDCVFVLDTNVLLSPYGAGTESLKAIEATYRKVLEQGRLYIPAQVAREFAANRGRKLADLHKSLLDHKSKIPSISRLDLPLYKELPEFTAVCDCADQVNNHIKSYQSEVDKLVSRVRDWYWDDPITSLYRKLFGQEVVREPKQEKEKILADLRRRREHNIPPGYKDSSKSDAGIGDGLIWHTILGIAQDTQRSCVFVSGDEKADWYVRSASLPLYPRFELVDEYRRNSKGQSFHIMRFSAFLELQGANEAAVNEIATTEFDVLTRQFGDPDGKFAGAVLGWILSRGRPPERFVHRIGGKPRFVFTVNGGKTEAVFVTPMLRYSRGRIGSRFRQLCIHARESCKSAPYDRAHLVVGMKRPAFNLAKNTLLRIANRYGCAATVGILDSDFNVTAFEPLVE
jgi:hypothetical protein